MPDTDQQVVMPPTIYDRVPLPAEAAASDKSCQRWRGEPPEPCENTAAYVFVYAANNRDDNNDRRNCLACAECCPEPTADATLARSANDDAAGSPTNDLEGWTRDQLVIGMATVGVRNAGDEFVEMGGGLRCGRCEHYIPHDAVDDQRCPRCGNTGLIGTVINGRQELTVLRPEGWFDES